MISRCLFLIRNAWVALACAATLPGIAQNDPLADPGFRTIGDNRTINDGVVTALTQDASGLVWVGTSIGVVRYDGYQLKAFRVDEGGRQFAGTSFVRSLLAAPGGRLWVGLEKGGLALLDTASSGWTVYGPDAADPAALAAGSVRALARDLDGRLWVGIIGGGLDSLDAGASGFRHHRRASGELPDDRVQTLLVDRRGDLWVGTWNGLVRRKHGGSIFEPVFAAAVPGGGAADGLGGKIVSMLGESPDGQIWVGTRSGELAIVDPGSGRGRWVVDAEGSGSRGANASLLTMAAAGPDEVWVGRANGLERRATRDGRLLQQLRRDPRKPWSLAGNNLAAMMRDASGGLWVGSYGGGLQRHEPGNGIWVRRGEGPDDGVLAEADVTSVLQLRSGEVWAGTNARGVAVMDAQLRLTGALRPEAGAVRDFSAGSVTGLAQTTDGAVWVGTEGKVYEYSPAQQLIRTHEAWRGRTRRLLATGSGGLWAATNDGLYRREAGAADFVRVALAGGKPLGGNVNALAEAADGSVWVGGEAGLYRLAAGEAALQRIESPAGAKLADSVVLGLLVDRRQVLWVDTSAGLHRLSGWEGGKPRFERIAPRHANRDDTGGARAGSFGANLLADAQGRIWTHQAVYDPRDGSQYELTEADGVDIGTGWFRSYTQLADGRMLFGGSRGLLVIDAALFKRWAYAPPLVVSEARIDGEKRPGAVSREGVVLSPRQRSLSLEFAALDYSLPARNHYRYRLQGVDADWVQTGADFRVASYGNLAPGGYVLTVQGSNRAGDWSPAVLQIPITVLPAWWQTWWARALAAGLLLLLVYAVVQLRTGLLRKQQRVLALKVGERTRELEALSLALQEKSQALEASSLTDPLTGLHNRRFLAQRIGADVALAQRRHDPQHVDAPHEADARQGRPIGDAADLIFFMLDIDHFKQVNDRHGHAAGDAVLAQMHARLQHVFRQTDYLIRWGGEEFLIVARFTARRHAAELAERARAAVADEPFLLDDGSRLQRTCSIGFACYPPVPALAAALPWSTAVDIADAALYAVKHGGRDGWLGLVSAQAESEAALRLAAALPLDEWVASGAVRMAGREGLALQRFTSSS